MAKRPPPRTVLAFIDTNIILDLYRAEGQAGLRLLRALLGAGDRLITTEQVMDEYRRNRVGVLASVMRSLSAPVERVPMPAAVASDAAAAIGEAHEALREARAGLTDALRAAITDPALDPVAGLMARYPKRRGERHLGHESPRFAEVLERARRRMELGNPPRKPRGASIGDAVNWEWCLELAAEGPHDLVVVTRDGDFGLVLDGHGSIPNEYLREEFDRCVGDGRRLVLTPLLGEAARQLGLRVSQRTLDEEARELPQLLKRLPLEGEARSTGGRERRG